MKIDDLAYTAVEHLAVVNLNIVSTSVAANHQFHMQPAPVERFVYITNGSVSLCVGEKKLIANSRDMIYMPRNTIYTSSWLTDSEFVVVDISLGDAHGKEISFGDTTDILFHDKYHVYNGLLTELADKTKDDDPFNWLERTSLCLKLLCEMARETGNNSQNGKYIPVKPAAAYIENNFADDFPILNLANMCHMSASKFRRLFFEYKGMSPIDYRNTLRIRRAAELLKKDTYTISEVAEKVGICDVKYFGKLFNRYIGTAPSAYKKNKQSK